MASRFDTECWVCDTQADIVMFGGKAPKPPDYSQVAAADSKAAQMQFDLGQEQLDWGKAQYEDIWPYAQHYLEMQNETTAFEQGRAKAAYTDWLDVYKPVEFGFAKTAMEYNTPERAEANAGAAMADVTSQFDAARRASAMQLESYGIDPSQTRYGALDLSARINQAASTAAAGTQSRRNTEATGLALMGEAVNIGKGYAGNIAQAFATSTNAGKSGVGAANDTYKTGAAAMGSPTSYMAGGNTALGNQAQAMNYGFNNQLGAANFNAQQSAGVGNMIGGALGFGLGFL